MKSYHEYLSYTKLYLLGDQLSRQTGSISFLYILTYIIFSTMFSTNILSKNFTILRIMYIYVNICKHM